MISDFDPPNVLHISLAPPRECTPGEGIYLALWQEFAITRPRDWHAIFRTAGPVRQRAASVSASFMVFMGCSGGRGFTYEAERFARQKFFYSREQAFLSAWALQNSRHRGVNHGLRMSEYMLARKHPVVGKVFGAEVDRKLIPSITQDDNDILESMVAWWSTDPASVMREIAELMIESANKKKRSNLFKPEFGNGNKGEV